MVGEQVQQDAAALLDRAAFDGEQIASAAVEVDVHFADEHDRAAFLDEYLEAIRTLTARYGGRDGLPYKIVVAAYPASTENTEDRT
jgi:hypothetical protein